jgi:choline dehydrogenase-like flavoprotein
MSTAYEPLHQETLMAFDCDVSVVGSGAGGATFAYACASRGKSVVIWERGRRATTEGRPLDERTNLIDKEPYDNRAVEVNGLPKRLYIGGVLGGGTALYGGALLRPSRQDFHPGIYYGSRIPRAIWDWPIFYDTLDPYYSEAERLYEVSGNDKEDFGPLQKPYNGFPNRPLPLHPINARLIMANQAVGLRPFRLPLAIDPKICLRCHACAGYVCPTGARRSSAQLLDRALSAGWPLSVRTNIDVERLELGKNGQVAGVCGIDRQTGERVVCRARRYVLAAGAIGSPLLLLRSDLGRNGGGPNVLGRNYQVHLSPIVIGFFSKPTGADETFVKQVGFWDFYFGTREFPHKMGLVQSLPVPGPLLMAKMAWPFLPKRLLGWLRRRMLPLAGIVEDLPDPANRVTCGSDGQPRLRHRFAAYDMQRGRHLARRMARILKKAGAALCLIKRFASDEHVAHQCGTLRFGRDPAYAVLDQDCRLFGHANVFVVDGSFMPTSLGVGPALTIAANALRVAKIVTDEI